ncbi:MAG: hypothetical protein MMC33_009890 [Icmadophila ericetorum]|nr:hypothetical protein [Icmadophila ericetorum]
MKEGEDSNPETCRQLFELVAGAKRPLTIEELREAFSIKPGKTIWDPKKLVNNKLRLLDRCKSLLITDEEQSTVHFTHHSVLQHLLWKPQEAELSTQAFKISMPEADRKLGQRDIRSSLEQIIQQQPEIREADKCAFYAYARKYWLVHTKSIDLSHGASANESLVKGNTLLQEAASQLQPSKIRLLLKHGADINAGGDVLLAACVTGNCQESMQILLAAGADSKAHGEVVSLLLDAGTNANAEGPFGNAIQGAACKGHEKTVSLLIDHGAEIHSRSELWDSALSAAAAGGHPRIVLLLLNNGAGKVPAEVKAALAEAQKALLDPASDSLTDAKLELVIQILELQIKG